MKRIQYFILLAATVFSATVSFCAEPEADQLMGMVTMGSKLKPDSKGRRELAAIAAKILKIKEPGSVRLRGNFPAADNEDDFLFKSILLAQEVEQQLKPLLKNRFQIYVMSAKYAGKNSAAPNSVEIFFYPRELKVEEMESLKSKTVQQQDRPKVIVVPEAQAQEAVQQGYEAVSRKPERALSDNRLKDSKKMKTNQDGEDPTLANELVNRAKARAAKRAKRQALEDAPQQ